MIGSILGSSADFPLTHRHLVYKIHQHILINSNQFNVQEPCAISDFGTKSSLRLQLLSGSAAFDIMIHLPTLKF